MTELIKGYDTYAAECRYRYLLDRINSGEPEYDHEGRLVPQSHSRWLEEANELYYQLYLKGGDNGIST